MIRIWLVDDHPRARLLLEASLPSGFSDMATVTSFSTFQDFKDTIEVLTPEHFPHIVFIDYFLEGHHTGLEVLEEIDKKGATPLCIGFSSVCSKAKELVVNGCSHYVVKETHKEILPDIQKLFPDTEALLHYDDLR